MQNLEQLTDDQLRRHYTEAHHHVETNRSIALEIERELNKRGIFIDVRQSYAKE
jgi:hypothetical protein